MDIGNWTKKKLNCFKTELMQICVSGVMTKTRFEERSVPKGFNREFSGMFPLKAYFFIQLIELRYSIYFSSITLQIAS